MRTLANLLMGLMLVGYLPHTRAQEEIANHGALQLHGAGSVGFHSDFSNAGPFESAEGLVGFYNETGALHINGSETLRLYDVEFATREGLCLHIPMQIANNANLISGDIQTSRKTAGAYPLFQIDAFYTGAGITAKVDGFAAMEHKETFRFPVGDHTRMRWLQLESQALNGFTQCAYFNEDPANSETHDRRFVSDNTDSGLQISQVEFWVLKGALPSRVTLSWDARSRIGDLAGSAEELRVVGYNLQTNTWDDLGNTQAAGAPEDGSITSDLFIPDQYAVLTLGGLISSEVPDELVGTMNYYLSPNGDGRNDILVLEATREHPDNSLQIYNRLGQLVYQKKNYQGHFNGHANARGVLQAGSGLQSGVYYYILTLNDLGEKRQGYFYLAN